MHQPAVFDGYVRNSLHSTPHALHHPLHNTPLTPTNSTTTIPATNTNCRTTPTTTQYLPCQTACRAGCGTYTETVTGTTSCLPSTTRLSTTTTTTTPAVMAQASSAQSTLTTVTPRACPTNTVSVSQSCPEDEYNCPQPGCYVTSTMTVPNGVVSSCPASTPVTSVTRQCKDACDWSCMTQVVTQSVAW